MAHDTPYGHKGCICWTEIEVGSLNGVAEERWMPNAGCRYHGLLAGYQPPRTDTGVYSIIPVGYKPPREPEPEPECPPGVHSMFDFCPGRATCEEGYPIEPCDYDGMYGEHAHIPNADDEPVCLVNSEVTTECKETGVLATARRWARRFGDWLDPHARHDRDLRADRRQRADLDGREPRDQGRER